jgi:TolB-like protein
MGARGVTGASKAVFLSYASQDVDAARRICDALRSVGVEVWFDQSELRGGDAWDRQIAKQIRECALFIALVSTHTDARPEGYFRREWRVAVERTRDMADDEAFLMPVVVDGTSNATARVPDKFKEVQWSRLPAGETSSAFVQHVSRLLSSEAPHSSEAMSPAASAHTVTPRQPVRIPAISRLTQLVLLVVAAVAIIGVGYFAADRFILSKRPAAGTLTSVSSGQSTAIGPSAIPAESIAVLPFVDMSQKKDQEYLGDGIADEILDRLARFTDLRVSGRTSSFYFKKQSASLAEIGKALHVAHVLEGSVRRSGRALRVTTQLIRVETGYHLWSQTYERTVEDVFKTQDDISSAVATALHTVLKSASTDLAGTSNAEAYDLYLRARELEQHFSRADVSEARVLYRRVVAADPGYVAAWAGLSRTSGQLAEFGNPPPGWDIEQREAGERVLQLAPNSMAAHFTLRGRYIADWNWSALRREDQALLELDRRTAARVGNDEFALLGNYERGLALLEEGTQRDPLAKWTWVWICDAYRVVGRLMDAERACRTALSVAPDDAGGHSELAYVLAGMQQRELAAAEVLRETDVDSRDFSLAIVYQLIGRAEDSARSVKAAWPRAQPMQKAEYFAARGDSEQAFDWWDRAINAHDQFAPWAAGDPLLNSLRQDPRYRVFLRKMNLPE